LGGGLEIYGASFNRFPNAVNVILNELRDGVKISISTRVRAKAPSPLRFAGAASWRWRDAGFASGSGAQGANAFGEFSPNGFADSGDAEREKRSQRLDEIQRGVTLKIGLAQRARCWLQWGNRSDGTEEIRRPFRTHEFVWRETSHFVAG
jgi:hypothetical protein